MGLFNSKACNLDSLAILNSESQRIIIFGETHSSDDNDYLNLFKSYDFRDYYFFVEASPTENSDRFKSGCHSEKIHSIPCKGIIYCDTIRSHVYINRLLTFCNALLIDFVISEECKRCTSDEAKELLKNHSETLYYAKKFKEVISDSYDEQLDNIISLSLIMRLLLLTNTNDVYSELISRLAYFNDSNFDDDLDVSVIQNIDNIYTTALDLLKSKEIRPIDVLELYSKELLDYYIIIESILQDKTNHNFQLLNRIKELGFFDDIKNNKIVLSFNDCLIFDIEFISKYFEQPIKKAVLLCGARHLSSISAILKMFGFSNNLYVKFNDEVTLRDLYSLCAY